MVAMNLWPFFWAVMLSTASGACSATSFDHFRAAASAALAVSPWNFLLMVLAVIVPPWVQGFPIARPFPSGLIDVQSPGGVRHNARLISVLPGWHQLVEAA